MATASISHASELPLSEVVEAQGHLIDSHIMERIFDTVVEYGGRFEVEHFSIGRTNSEPSSLAFAGGSSSQEQMEQMMTQLLGLGCAAVDSGDAELKASPSATAVLPKISIQPLTSEPWFAIEGNG